MTKHPENITVYMTRVGAQLPKFATLGAAGADLHACLPDPIDLLPGEWTLVPTGLTLEIPVGYEVQVRPRSGLANKFGVTVLNAPGTIDSDYRGELMVMLVNHGHEPFRITHGDRIAQIVFAESIQVGFVSETDTVRMSTTERGTGGFGSTGI